MFKERGVTLIEVMIVVIIAGVLASLAIPRYMFTTVVSRQKEAQSILKQIYVLQRAYQMEHDGYYIPGPGVVASAANPAAFTPLALELMASARYSYTIEASGMGFVARATTSDLDDDATLDIWRIDDTGELVADSDDAVN